jgi:hypothetical protein
MRKKSPRYGKGIWRCLWTHWALAHKPKDPVNDTYDLNTEKKGIYGVMRKVLQDATSAARRQGMAALAPSQTDARMEYPHAPGMRRHR